MSYTLEALRGVKGFVKDEVTGLAVGGVQLRIKGREIREFNTTDQGEFWRILLDGNYILKVGIVYNRLPLEIFLFFYNIKLHN